jgi:hypothetical protein
MPALTRPTLPTQPDEERLNAVLDRIRANPDSLDMRFFYRTGIEDVCGTTECFAGHTIELFAPSGQWWWNADVPMSIGGTAAWSIILTDKAHIPAGIEATELDDGTYEVAAAYYAAALLGLNNEQHEALFYYLVDDVDMLAARVQQILDGDYSDGEV